jgi:PPM family protein phosphatase
MLRAAETVCRTDTGRQRRNNEDNAYARAPVFVVADGMGGAQAGEVASKIAIEAFERALPDSGSAEERLADRVREANRQIHERSLAEDESAGMGTTLTAAYLDDARVAIAHVGDSRAYLFRDGTLQRLTQDHSLVDELMRQGKLSEEEAADFPARSVITRALGPEPDVEVDTWSYPVRAGDILLLCSDGLTSMLSEARVSEILAGADSLQDAADQLIRAANEAGGRDNITVVLFRIEEASGDGVADAPTLVESPTEETILPSGERTEQAPASAVALAPRPTRPPVARTPAPPEPGPSPSPPRRFARPLAALLAVVIVLVVLGAGGYLASRQLYFIGTNAQGIVTIYRGFPYDLPAGIHLYETFYVSGVPASLVPADRRGAVFDNHLRSQKDAESLVRALELGNVSK